MPPHPPRQIGIDLGGSLIKLVQVDRADASKLEYCKFEQIGGVLDHLRALATPCAVAITGGGSVKHYDAIREAHRGDLLQLDEMLCLSRGLALSMPGEITYPCILVNIGSGISILNMRSVTEYTRVGGSAFGGATLLAMMRLVNPTDHLTYEEYLAIAENGDTSKVDMSVGDIYGADYGVVGLDSSVVASHLGKLANGSAVEYKSADIYRSLIVTFSNNIGQMAYLSAVQNNVSVIMFSGSTVQRFVADAIEFAVNYYSKGQRECSRAITKRDGLSRYVGALGALFHQ